MNKHHFPDSCSLYSAFQLAAVCWLRLDFDTFSLLGTGATTETEGGVCQDTFTVTVSLGISNRKRFIFM